MKKNKPHDPNQKYVFADKVFRDPFTPFFDSYKDHVFVIENRYDDHLALKCVDDPSIRVSGLVEMDLLRRWWG